VKPGVVAAVLRPVRLSPWVEGEARRTWHDADTARAVARSEYSRRLAVAVEARRNQGLELDFPAVRARIMGELGLSEADLSDLFAEPKGSSIP
jgi:hypothetical protein